MVEGEAIEVGNFGHFFGSQKVDGGVRFLLAKSHNRFW